MRAAGTRPQAASSQESSSRTSSLSCFGAAARRMEELNELSRDDGRFARGLAPVLDGIARSLGVA